MKININGPENIKNIQKSTKNTSKDDFLPQKHESNLLNKEVQSTSQKNYINVQLNTLTSIQRNILIRELLDLPKEWLKLLNVLLSSSGNSQLKTIVALLNSKQTIDPNLIKELLSGNSKNLLDKLIKLTNHNANNLYSIEQMKEVLTVVSSLIPDKNTSKQELIKDILLLYLPYYPIDEKTLKDRFDVDEFSAMKALSEDETIIFVNTKNMGMFRVSIFIGEQNDLNVFINNINTGIDSKYTTNLYEHIERKFSEVDIKANITKQTKIIKDSNIDPDRQFFIQQAGVLTAKTLMVMQIILKTMFEADEKILNLI